MRELHGYYHIKALIPPTRTEQNSIHAQFSHNSANFNVTRLAAPLLILYLVRLGLDATMLIYLANNS